MTQANGWFFKKAKQDHVASRKKGRAIFKDALMIEITIPGDKASKVVQNVSDAEDDPNKLRFPKAWENFQAATKQVGEGMPLEEWPMMTASRVMELKSLHIHTVEQLSELNESFIAKLGPNGRELMEQAKSYLEVAEKGPGQAAQENKQLSDENETLKQSVETNKETIGIQERQIKKLQSDIETLEAEKASLSESAQSLQDINTSLNEKIAELEANAVNPEMSEEEKAAQEAETKAAEEAAKADKDAEVKANLRAQIEAKTGEKVKGNPSLKTLKAMLKDA